MCDKKLQQTSEISEKYSAQIQEHFWVKLIFSHKCLDQ